MASREEIYGTLFKLLQQLNPTTASPEGDGTLMAPAARIFQPFSQCPLQPWLCMLPDSEAVEYPLYNGPSKRTMSATVIVYSRQNDPNVPAGKILNDLVDAIEGVIRPDTIGADKEQTMGGLVTWVRFAGKTTEYVGTLLEQAVTVMQFDILATR